MPDSVVKKVIIPKGNLVSGDNNEYIIRYRIVSEDKNRTSHWSPAHKITATGVQEVDGAVSATPTVITVVWGDELNMPKYDVFVKFDSDDIFYHGTPAVHSYSFLNKGTTSVQVIIQVEGINKIVNESLIIYDSGTVSLV